jgi:hypothetical protein
VEGETEIDDEEVRAGDEEGEGDEAEEEGVVAEEKETRCLGVGELKETETAREKENTELE